METAKKSNYNYCDTTGTNTKTGGTGVGDSTAQNKYDDWVGSSAPNLVATLSSEPGPNKKCSTYVVVN